MGVLQIQSELVHYTGKTATEISGCTRGYDGTSASDHNDGTLVTSGLPQNAGNSWQYGIPDINGK